MKSPLWQPTAEQIERSHLNRYRQWLYAKRGLAFAAYEDMWKWSVADSDAFWKSLWEYFDIQYDGEIDAVNDRSDMPGVRWFEGVRINYAEHIFRHSHPDRIALIHASEDKPIREVRWDELKRLTGALQNLLSEAGVHPGDRVAAYVPCCPEATVGLLAATGLGAIWSSCSPDFGAQSVIDRFAQIKPKVLIATGHYRYGGKEFDKTETVARIVDAIPSIQMVIWLTEYRGALNVAYRNWSTIVNGVAPPPRFVRVDFNHSLWTLYSSGTTGLPKAIVHSHGGILLEQFKYHAFHQDARQGERCFWYTTTGWMMWNYLHGSLLLGATMATYDGSPSYPNLYKLWELVEEMGLNHFGSSAGHLLACRKEGVKPAPNNDLSALRAIGSTGSTLPEEGFEWVYKDVKSNVWLASISGGTDVCTAFVGGNPTLPVYAGEIQCRALGCALYAWDENGRECPPGAVGEMVITQPMPSMPTSLWGDERRRRYKKSYFEPYPHAWRHGDWVSLTERGSIVIYGRSDATLNRGGVRIGASEVYRAILPMAEVKDGLIVCVERHKGNFYMPLFVRLQHGYDLTAELAKKIKNSIRQTCSPRHVPDEIIETPDIPYTLSGKKVEIPVKKILMGLPAHEVVNPGVLKNPQCITFYADFYRQRLKRDSL